jgi:putative MATE family efflux protein
METGKDQNPIKRHAPGGYGELWAMAYPVMVATLSQSMMGVVDTFYMGRVGTAEQGAVGLAAILFWTISSLFVGTLHGISTFVAQHYGAGKNTQCGRDGWLGLFLTVPSALILGSIALYAETIFQFIGSDPTIIPHATDYITIRLGGAFFVCINYALISFLRGLGDTKTPMYFTLGANVVNIVIDYPLILGHWGSPALGASGAALGSVTATALFSTAYLAFFLTGERNRQFRTRRIYVPRLRDVIDFLKVGAPVGGNWALEMTSWTVFMAIVSTFGNVALASTEIVFEVLHFSFMGAVALGTAATTLVGQYLGAEDPATAQKAARSTIVSSVIYCMSMGVVFYLFRRHIVEVFTLDPEVVEVGARLFIYAAVFQFFDGLGISCTGVIRGAGDTRWPMVLMVVLGFGIFIPLTFALAKWGGLGIDGAWTAATLFIVSLSAGLYFRYRTGKWKGMRV